MIDMQPRALHHLHIHDIKDNIKSIKTREVFQLISSRNRIECRMIIALFKDKLKVIRENIFKEAEWNVRCKQYFKKTHIFSRKETKAQKTIKAFLTEDFN